MSEPGPAPQSVEVPWQRLDARMLLLNPVKVARSFLVPVVITTNDTHNARKLRQVAGNAVRAGLPHAAAIAAITSAPAVALGLGAKYGTLAPGKVANLVVWSGDPLEIASRPLAVVIRGKKVDLGNRQSALFTRYRKLPIAR